MSNPEYGTHGFLTMNNGQAASLSDVPVFELADFQERVRQAVFFGQRVSSFFATSPSSVLDKSGGRLSGGGDEPELIIVLSDDDNNALSVGRCRVKGGRFSSLTPHCPQVHLFEREIAEQAGLIPEGHPWLKPVRFASQQIGSADSSHPVTTPRIGVVDFYRLHGEEVHEVAVGPVHAGVIEPGHFRFQCHGETVYHLEISLGYQHRGVERAFCSAGLRKGLHLAETLAGDSTLSHGLAYCMTLEALGGAHVPARAECLRAVGLELERIANHIGDLGGMAADVGFLPTSSYCGRIRGDALNLTALLCGNRFGRGLTVPGGVGFDAESARVSELLTRLDALEKDLISAVGLLWETPSVMARFEATGALSEEFCDEMGLVGPPARAAGATRDVRVDQPFGMYNFSHLPTASWNTGDVYARAYVRWMEIEHSITFIRDQLRAFPGGGLKAAGSERLGGVLAMPAQRLAVSLVEGWRGEVCHVALTNEEGGLARYKVVDPSFHNWPGLAFALRGQQISDFPLCNKSFNLSYCGHDL